MTDPPLFFKECGEPDFEKMAAHLLERMPTGRDQPADRAKIRLVAEYLSAAYELGREDL